MSEVCPSGKIVHETNQQAHDHVVSLNRSGKRIGETDVYRCRLCGFWHVGRLARRRANELKRRAVQRTE